MSLNVGSILDGKVTGIVPFGAFVKLSETETGLVHISEVANTYVKDVRDFIKEGDEVKVKVLDIKENGKISLSIKQSVENNQAQGGTPTSGEGRQGFNNNGFNRRTDNYNKSGFAKRQDNYGNNGFGRRPDTFNNHNYNGGGYTAKPAFRKAEPPVSDFEKMLANFKKDSELRIADSNRAAEPKKSRPSKKK